MPNRIVREGILTSPKMARLGWAEEVFFRRLMSVVDDFGRYYADPGLLRAACYPRQLSKVSDPDVVKWTQCAEEAGLVRVYPAEDGERYVEILNFGQQVRAKASKFPNPPSVCVADAKQVISDAQQTPANAHLDVSVSVSVEHPNGCMPTAGENPPTADLGGPRPAIPECPHSDIVSAYHEILPELARVRTWDSDRQKFLRGRWREDAERQSVDWWRDFFRYVRTCPLLMGQVERRDAAPWAADLEWLVRPSNFRKVIEGRYEARAA